MLQFKVTAKKISTNLCFSFTFFSFKKRLNNFLFKKWGKKNQNQLKIIYKSIKKVKY